MKHIILGVLMTLSLSVQSAERNNSFFKGFTNYPYSTNSLYSVKDFIKEVTLSVCLTNSTMVWGPTGHRVVGEIASKNISNKTRRRIAKLLDNQSLAFVSTFADEIRSDERYRKLSPWHYVSLDFGEMYNESERNPDGDIIFAIRECIRIIKDKQSTKEDRAFYLRLLIHFIGDLHQPLHVGRAEDRGGNDISVTWFGRRSNLHRVWDSNMIDSYMMSYTELSDNLPSISKEQKNQIQQGTLLDWVYESQELAEKVYASTERNSREGYEYQYNNFSTVMTQLQKGGLRLAKLLDQIFE